MTEWRKRKCSIINQLQSLLLKVNTHKVCNPDTLQEDKKWYSTIEEELDSSVNVIEILSFFSSARERDEHI